MRQMAAPHRGASRGQTTVDLPVYCFTNVGRIKLRYVNLNNSYDVT